MMLYGKGESKSFTITFSYKNGESQNRMLNSYLNFEFVKNYTITYQDLENSSNYPANIAEGLTYMCTFESGPKDFIVTMGGNNLTKDTDFTYKNKILKVPNVTGDLVLTAEWGKPLSNPIGLTGLSLANRFKTLANNGNNVDGYSSDTKIQSVVRATKEQYEAKKDSLTSLNCISNSGNSKDVYTWFEEGTIYLYTEADKILMTGNMEKAFCKMTNLTDISALEHFDMSNVTDINRMFQDSTNITDLSALANWDVSNVTNMSFMFGANVGGTSPESAFMKIKSIEPLRNWNVANVTNMDSMFKGCAKVTSVEPVKDWDVSKVTNFQQMFNRCGLTDARDIQEWNVQRNANYNMMLANMTSLPKANRPIFTVLPGRWNDSGTYLPQ